MTEEIKMVKFDEIQKLVSIMRNHEEMLRQENKKAQQHRETLFDLGIQCNNVTSCVDIAKKCYRCRNNYARRSYFQNLIQKGIDVSEYSADASCFNAIEKGGE